jgi:hypothetical protein
MSKAIRTVVSAAPIQPSAFADPLSRYKKATEGFAARFAGLNADRLFEAENAYGDADGVDEFISPLLGLLADWQRHLTTLRQTISPAALTPDTVDFIERETAAWESARQNAYQAYVEWSFTPAREVETPHGRVVIPALDGRLPVASAFPRLPLRGEEPTGCRVAGCDGVFHYEGTCAVTLDALPFEQGELNAELVSNEGQDPYLVVFSFQVSSGETRQKMTDPAEGRAFAARMRRFAYAVEAGAARLEAMQKAEGER